MCQLMIVDDEHSVVDSLALTINWKEHGISQVHRAYSAEEALEIAVQHCIDIMITDIQMHEMDGFQLNEKVKECSPQIKTIILSGHDDFIYAQQAIRQKTIDYLLKPVDFKQLIITVKNTIKNIEKEVNEANSYQRLKYSLNVNLPMLRSQLLNELLMSEKISPHIISRLEVFDASFLLDNLFTMMVIRLEQGFSSHDLHSLSLFEFAVTNLTEEIFKESFDLWYCTTDQGYVVFILKSENHENLKVVNSYAQKLKEKVQSLLNGALSIYISNTGVFPYDVSSIYRNAVETLHYKIGNNKECNTIQDFYMERKSGDTINLYESPTITALLEDGNWDGALTRISTILTLNDTENEPSMDHLFKVLLYLSSSFSLLGKEKNKTVEENLGEEFYLLFQKKSLITKHRIYNWAKKWIENIRKQTTTHMENSQQRRVATVRSFIHENLSNDLSLHTIAERVGMHPVYLSKLYKHITNETIGEYIHQVRMKRADYLLRKTNLKISDIGSELGYFSQSHFIKVFKKHYGYPPQQYRNKI
jgi:two-component system, response regulator YesN